MFSRPLFPSMFDDPFFSARDPFSHDPFFDEWNDLLRQQWADQQRFRQRASQARQQQAQQPQQQIKDSGSSNMDIERKYDNHNNNNNCAKECNNMNNCATSCGPNKCATKCNNKNNKQVATTSGNNNNSSSGSGAGTVARPRSFWDLTEFPSWSGLTPQQLRLEWAGTEPSSKEYTVSAYLPDGMTPNDMTISVDERSRLMTLKCQTKSHEEEKDKDGHVISSRSSSSFTQRSIQLPRDVDLSAISASKNNNNQSGSPQLLLHLPKLPQPVAEPGVKQITIQ